MAKEIIKTRTSKNAETLGALYIYIYIDTLTDKWNWLTRPHTFSTEMCYLLCWKCKVGSYLFSYINLKKRTNKIVKSLFEKICLVYIAKQKRMDYVVKLKFAI